MMYEATVKEQESPWPIMFLIFLLSTMDAVFTAAGVSAGYYEEANPLMRIFLDKHLLLFLFAKSFMVGIGLAVLGYLWDHKWARIGTVVTYTVYTALLCIHTYYLTTVSLQ
jgi:hypothetical protein